MVACVHFFFFLSFLLFASYFFCMRSIYTYTLHTFTGVCFPCLNVPFIVVERMIRVWMEHFLAMTIFFPPRSSLSLLLLLVVNIICVQFLSVCFSYHVCTSVRATEIHIKSIRVERRCWEKKDQITKIIGNWLKLHTRQMKRIF